MKHHSTGKAILPPCGYSTECLSLHLPSPCGVHCRARLRNTHRKEDFKNSTDHQLSLTHLYINMKSALKCVIFLLFAIGVFGDAVSVIEGDSVTLHTGVAEIQRDDVEWRLNGKRIARIKAGSISTEGAFGDRLQLDKQTGDLKITDIRTTDSGEYKLEITSTRGSSEKIFSVSVVSGDDEVKSVSMIEGDSVTLNSGTIIQRDDVIEWRFGDLNTLIAENNRKTGNFSTSDGPDGRFRDRLKLDYTTGSLTIRKIEIKHSGFYEAVIRKSSSGYTIYKSYSVTASGEMKSAQSVKTGESVTLHTGLTDIQTDDLMQWMFGDTVLAEFNKENGRFLTSDGLDGRFRGRLTLDHQTGSLTITHTTTTDSGDYELKTIISRFIIYKTFPVTVTGEMMSALLVSVGKSVTLNSDLTDIQRVDLMQWMFGDSQIAEFYKAGDRFLTSVVPDGRFRDRLKLDNQTGSLTITHTTHTDSGKYTLKISNSRRTVLKTITVFVTDPPMSAGAKAGIVLGVLLAFAAAVAGVVFYSHRKISEMLWLKTIVQSVMEGESITLNPGDDKVQKDWEIQWMFRSSTIAERESGADSSTVHDDRPDGSFKDRLKLDPQTGSLTIKDTRNADSGEYQLQINRSGKISIKRFRVSVFDKTHEIVNKLVKEGGSVKLETDVTADIKDGQIQWLFGYTPLVIITRETEEFSKFGDEIFKDRLKLDCKTVSLTINKIRPSDDGIYVLYIIGTETMKTTLFRVKVDPTDFRNNSEENDPFSPDSRL